MDAIPRLGTGVKGLDDIIGGYPQGRSILVTGDAGAGKTIMALHFAIESARKGLKTVYVTTEEDETDLRIQCASLGWDIDELMESGALKIIGLSAIRARLTEAEIHIGIESVKGNLQKILAEIPEDTEVLVIDSIGSHTEKLTTHEFRDQFDLLIYELKKRGITALIILDSATSMEFNEIALYAVYGAIKLIKRENPYTGRRERVMDIIKMRSTRTPIEFVPYIISDDGLEVIENPDE
ncbi:AAA family ATPase [Methanothermobacter marburgensis]|uniref:Circadian clock related protein n=1 Tax=Methanothermobacter marburgensis (strain ATCC BAA-927 / DSM 2133 / JCM 14651 / NBRC 100331 / OCM 82 / Marburg) TaxID=79929 RepID=D9PW31_METTM|nr:ATPase domain-containing protein [Methanothermobacter marburgensis]ADL58429.1 circadian clock related protein [Methanothermobacter marburgensis str. Marburg]WBF10568.1 AAA family ATPase [Methanothermobacter marburgensis]